MTKNDLLGGTVHELPTDLAKLLSANSSAKKTWQDITPLARNEWTCLVISAGSDETRQRRLGRTLDQLSRGQRRPCCWGGCPHREKNTKK